MVKWSTHQCVYEQAAQLLLIARFNDTITNQTKDACAVNSLTGNKLKADNLLPSFKGDRIEKVVCAIPAENILSEAYILPTIEMLVTHFLTMWKLPTTLLLFPNEQSGWR